MHLFNSFNNFLTNCVHYLEERFFTGKFIEDIKNLLIRFGKFYIKNAKEFYILASKTKEGSEMLNILKKLGHMLIKIPLLEILFSFIGTTIRLIITCYSQIFIVFAITFTTSILLLNWFQSSITTFCVGFLPLMIINIIAVSALYYCIDRRETGDKISLGKSFLFVLRHVHSVCFPIILESAIILETSVIFIIIALFLSYTFSLFHLSWSGSPFYWFVIIVFGALILLGLFTLSIVMPQTYFSILLDHIPFHQAFQSSKTQYKTRLFYFILSYLIFYIIGGLFLWHMILSSLYVGFTIGIYLILAVGTFLAFLLRRRFWMTPEMQKNTSVHATHLYIFFNTIIIFGFINYILLSVLLVKEYQPLLSFVRQQQDSYLASQEMKQYTNNSYGYSLAYPQSWSLYPWHPDSVAFYNNYTGTVTGGTWMTVNVMNDSNSPFTTLYNASPGVVVDDPNAKEIITKVSNMTIQGYPAVDYTIIRTNLPYKQYETHYLIHKGVQIYDVGFTSITNDISSYNSTLFQEIINSFRFIQ